MAISVLVEQCVEVFMANEAALLEARFDKSLTSQIPAKDVLKSHHLKPLELRAKEGLGLINGTQFILAHTITGLLKMEYLLDLADVSPNYRIVNKLKVNSVSMTLNFISNYLNIITFPTMNSVS